MNISEVLKNTVSIENYSPDSAITFEEMQKTLGITNSELDEIYEVEFE